MGAECAILGTEIRGDRAAELHGCFVGGYVLTKQKSDGWVGGLKRSRCNDTAGGEPPRAGSLRACSPSRATFSGCSSSASVCV